MSDSSDRNPAADLEPIAARAGRWKGTNRFRLMPDDEFTPTDSTVEVERHAKGMAVTVAYTWAESGVDQSGVMLLTESPDGGVQAVWLDSWHQQPSWMSLTGASDGGIVTVDGSYPGGGRWQIIVDPTNGLRLRMRNAVPGVDLYDVVDTELTPAD
jgi:hypothetical protein